MALYAIGILKIRMIRSRHGRVTSPAFFTILGQGRAALVGVVTGDAGELALAFEKALRLTESVSLIYDLKAL